MSVHPDLQPLLDGGPLHKARRRELLEHVAGCAACRAALAAEDPSLLFSLLTLEPVPPSVLERVSRGVAQAAEAAGRDRAPRRWALASLAASLFVAVALGGYAWLRPAPAPVVQATQAEPVPRQMPADTAVPVGMIELLESPGEAQVLEIDVGQARLVMIFDEALDI